MMMRVLLAEDQSLVLGALAALLNLESDIEVVGRASDGEMAWRELQRLQPDVLVTDIEMPGLTGLELAQRVQRHELPVKVVIVTTFARAGFLRRALDAGVAGYLLKDEPAEKLAEALRSVHRGGRAIDPQLALEAWTEADPLSDRERQVLRLAGEGVAASDIAQRLGLSHGTVRNYLSEIIGKLGVSNRIEAYRMARQKGWL
jgi:two-component system response regulator DesR